VLYATILRRRAANNLLYLSALCFFLYFIAHTNRDYRDSFFHSPLFLSFSLALSCSRHNYPATEQDIETCNQQVVECPNSLKTSQSCSSQTEKEKNFKDLQDHKGHALNVCMHRAYACYTSLYKWKKHRLFLPGVSSVDATCVWAAWSRGLSRVVSFQDSLI